VQGDSLEFSDAKHNVMMKDYLTKEILDSVTATGYPMDTFRVLRVSSGITPGHSGAPIVDANNYVVGIGSGGLSKQGFQRVNWAAPAKTYLPHLEDSKDSKQVKPREENKYQFSVSEATPNSVRSNQHNLYGIYTIPLNDILEALAEEVFDAEELKDLYDTAELINYDLTTAYIDVYQDVNTGATVFVPAGASIEAVGNVFKSVAPGSKVEMFIEIAETDSFDAAQKKLEAFGNTIAPAGNWVADEESTSVENEPENGHFSVEMWANEFDAGNNVTRMLATEITIDYGEGYADFLGLAVMLHASAGQSDLQYFHQMIVCLELSGFAMY
jgi:hypothetical protein